MTLRAHLSIEGRSVGLTLIRHGESGNAVLRFAPMPMWEPVVPGEEVSPTMLLTPADSDPVIRALAHLEHVARETP